MISTIEQVLNKLAPLSRRKNLNVACVLGLLAGGLGLALYFRTAVDLIIPVAIALVTVIARAHNSNERLALTRTA